jgi:hypothetical protein
VRKVCEMLWRKRGNVHLKRPCYLLLTSVLFVIKKGSVMGIQEKRRKQRGNEKEM